MAVQGTINSALGKEIGLTETTFVVHLVAVLILIFVLFFQVFQGENSIQLSMLWELPWYLYLGGILGVLITYTVAFSIPQLGVAVATTGIVAVQVSTAALIDHLGILGMEREPFSVMRLIGIIFLAVGVKLLLS
ncbi:MAG: DMT family transporter [Halanaerobiaceae bacterium]